MHPKDFGEAVRLIRKEDSRYGAGAYYFVRQALDHTVRKQAEEKPGKRRHVTGQQLLEGIREYALEQYGPMTLTMFNEWGLRRCEDFGDVVFNLVDYEVLGKTDNDQREDFSAAYDFEEAFAKPFQPRSQWRGHSVRIPVEDRESISNN